MRIIRTKNLGVFYFNRYPHNALIGFKVKLHKEYIELSFSIYMYKFEIHKEF